MIKNILPNFASDTAGACSALFESGGLVVIHDAAGCMENYVCYEEPRMFGSDSLIFSSGLGYMEAALGGDGVLIEKTVKTAEDMSPRFIALIGSPVPDTIGMDMDGIALEIESASGVPAFAVPCGGFKPYYAGASEAMKRLIKKLARPSKKKGGFTANLLGATPLDFSNDDIEYVKSTLKRQKDVHVSVPFMEDDVLESADADINIVISASGLAAAKYMREAFGIPYSVGIPMDERSAEACLSGKSVYGNTPVSEAKILIIGETVFAASLAGAVFAETGEVCAVGAVGSTESELLSGVGFSVLDSEDKIKSELCKSYAVIAGDPLYRQFLPDCGKTAFIERPHPALSSRLFSETSINNMILRIKESISA